MLRLVPLPSIFMSSPLSALEELFVHKPEKLQVLDEFLIFNFEWIERSILSEGAVDQGSNLGGQEVDLAPLGLQIVLRNIHSIHKIKLTYWLQIPKKQLNLIRLKIYLVLV